MKATRLDKIQSLCCAGFCPISTLTKELECTTSQLMEILNEAPFSFRISKNINGIQLLVINPDKKTKQ